MQNDIRAQFLCVAHPLGNEGWEAFSLDFDIAVHAKTFDEAKNILTQAVVTYIEDAMKEAEPDRSRLLNRRAPLWVRLTWGVRFFLEAVRDRRGQSTAVGFPISCPV